MTKIKIRFLFLTMALFGGSLLAESPCDHIQVSVYVNSDNHAYTVRNQFGVNAYGVLVQQQSVAGGPWACGVLSGEEFNYKDIGAAAVQQAGYLNLFVVTRRGELEQYQWTLATNWQRHVISAALHGPRISRLTQVTDNGSGVAVFARRLGHTGGIIYSWSPLTNWTFQYGP